MNKTKHVDSSIQILKAMLGDQSNELESEGKRALASAIGKLKSLRRQPDATHADIYRTVAEVAELVSEIASEPGRSEFHS
jgi:hypothetical protein